MPRGGTEAAQSRAVERATSRCGETASTAREHLAEATSSSTAPNLMSKRVQPDANITKGAVATAVAAIEALKPTLREVPSETRISEAPCEVPGADPIAQYIAHLSSFQPPMQYEAVECNFVVPHIDAVLESVATAYETALHCQDAHARCEVGSDILANRKTTKPIKSIRQFATSITC